MPTLKKLHNKKAVRSKCRASRKRKSYSRKQRGGNDIKVGDIVLSNIIKKTLFKVVTEHNPTQVTIQVITYDESRGKIKELSTKYFYVLKSTLTKVSSIQNGLNTIARNYKNERAAANAERQRKWAAEAPARAEAAAAAAEAERAAAERAAAIRVAAAERAAAERTAKEREFLAKKAEYNSYKPERNAAITGIEDSAEAQRIAERTGPYARKYNVGNKFIIRGKGSGHGGSDTTIEITGDAYMVKYDYGLPRGTAKRYIQKVSTIDINEYRESLLFKNVSVRNSGPQSAAYDTYVENGQIVEFAYICDDGTIRAESVFDGY